MRKGTKKISERLFDRAAFFYGGAIPAIRFIPDEKSGDAASIGAMGF
jgi:hypothetical protein